MTIQGQNHQNKQLCEIDCWFIAIQGSWGAERAFFFALECVPTMGRDSDHVGELPSKGHFAYEQVGVEQTGQIQN
jgi:hypothetical protein